MIKNNKLCKPICVEDTIIVPRRVMVVLSILPSILRGTIRRKCFIVGLIKLHSLTKRKGIDIMTTLLLRALNYAVKTNEGRYNPDGQPRIAHNLYLVTCLARAGVTEDVLLLALFHDVATDDPSFNLADIIKPKSLDRLMRGINCLTQGGNEADIEYIKRVSGDVDALIVKILDIMHHNEEAGKCHDIMLQQLKDHYERIWLENHKRSQTQSEYYPDLPPLLKIRLV